MLVDPNKTKAILIGVSEFQDKEHFVNAPPIKNNISKLKTLLADPLILGLSENNIKVFDQNQRHDDILIDIQNFLDEGFADTLIFYFAGHGYKTKDDKFFLATNNTRVRLITSSAIPWEELRKTFEKSGKGIQQRFYILEACHSGAATLSDSSEMLDIDKGSALLAAAAEDEKAYFDKKETYTDFTRALIETIENGVENTEIEALDIGRIDESINSLLKKYGNRFDTQIKKTDKIENVFLFKNKKYDVEIHARYEIQEDISWVKELIESQQYKKAVKILRQAKRDTDLLKNKKNLPGQIDKLLADCKYLPLYTPRIEKILIAKQTKVDEDKRAHLDQLEKEVSRLKKEIGSKEKEIIALKKTDKSNLDKIIILEKQASELEEAVEVLKTEKGQLIDQIANLTATSKENNYLKSEIINIEEEFVHVVGNSFSMGSQANDKYADDDEKPQHEVNLSDFYIGKTPVTQQLWNEIMKENPSDFKDVDKPVENVSWYDAIEFCNKLSEKDGRTTYYSIDKKSKDPDNISDDDDLKWKVEINTDANGYRLPTEAEWEYAARGGNKSEGYTYAGSNDIDEVAWYEKNSDSKTHPVESKKPNELGIYNMNGNVWEWCWDWFDEAYYKECKAGGTVENPAGPASGSFRVQRGDSWYDIFAQDCRVASRGGLSNPDGRSSFYGFRLVFVP